MKITYMKLINFTCIYTYNSTIYTMIYIFRDIEIYMLYIVKHMTKELLT